MSNLKVFEDLNNVSHVVYKVYAIKDTKVGFMQPFIQVNHAVAIREFGNIVNAGNSIVSANYQDMELYCLGSYNQDTGEIISKVDYIIKGVDVKAVNNIESAKG